MKTCLVHGCTNNSADGAFVGDLCAPCHRYITTGQVGPTKSFLAKLTEQDHAPINTPAGKEKFIRTLCDRLRDSTIERIPAMPDTWDGHELRRYLSDLFSYEVTDQMRGMRLREYKNTIATKSVL